MESTEDLMGFKFNFFDTQLITSSLLLVAFVAVLEYCDQGVGVRFRPRFTMLTVTKLATDVLGLCAFLVQCLRGCF
jgi:hypothetical protein